MPQENNLTIDPNNALTWPEDAPAISMDVDLGRAGSNERNHRINFDMAKYYKLLSKQKLTSEEKRNLHVLIHDIEKNDMGYYVLGEYNPIEDHTVNVRFEETNFHEPKLEDLNLPQTNNTLLHETKHYIQDKKNRLPDTKAEAILFWYGLRYAVPLGVLATGIAVNKTTGFHYFPGLEGAFATHFMARFLTGYKYRICEISARHFARSHAEEYGSIITTTPMPENVEQEGPYDSLKLAKAA